MAPTITSHGFWGPITSTIDWCESNYSVTIYIAEFWNTLSNLFFIVPPLIAYFRLQKQNVERIYLLSLLYLSITGIGSFFFHMTLKYPMQLWDELAMVFEALLLIYLFIKALKPNLADNLYTQISLPMYGLIVTAVYLCLQMPMFFQIAYGTLAYTVMALGFCLSKYKESDTKFFYITVATIHTGFLLWTIDNHFCHQLEGLRERLPSFIVPFTHLHAWWHFLVGYGTYILILYCIHARQLSLKKNYAIVSDKMVGFIIHQQKTFHRDFENNNQQNAAKCR